MNWKCAYCHNCFEFSSEKPVKFCPHCGKETNFQCNVQTDEAHSTMQKVCPVCSTEISSDEEQIVCPDCKMAYHKDCWNDNNGCATYGCRSAGCLNPPPMKIDVASDTGLHNGSVPENSQASSSNSLECPFCHTRLSAGTKICWSCGHKLTSSPVDADAPKPGPWRRLIARQADFIPEFVFVAIFLAALGISNEMVFGVAACLLAMLLDSAVYAICGNTLGKWLMGIRIVTQNGLALPAREYLIRNLRVLWGGYGLFIPLVSLFTMYTQYNRLNRNEETTYDEAMQFKAVRHNSNAVKSFFGVAYLLIFFIVLTVLLTAANAME